MDNNQNPNTDPDFQNQYGSPEIGETTVLEQSMLYGTQEPDSGSPKKKGSKKPLLIPLIILLVAAIGAGGFFAANKFLDKKQADKKKNQEKSGTLRKESVFKEIVDLDSPISDYIGLEDIRESVLKDNCQFKGSVTVDSDNIDSKQSLSYDISRDAKTKTIGLSTSIKKIVKIDTYLNPDGFFVNVPLAGDSVYTLSTDSIQEMLESKTEDNVSDTLVKDALSNMLGEWESTSSVDALSILVCAIEDTYPEDYKEIKASIKKEEIEKDKNGNAGYEYTFTEDGIKLFLEKSITVFFDNKELRDYFETYSKMFVIEGNDIVTSDERIKSAKDSVKLAISMLSFDDITWKAWFTKDDLIAGLEFNHSIEIGPEELKFDLSLSSDDKTNPSNNMLLKAKLSVDKDYIDFEYERNRKTEKDTDSLIETIRFSSSDIEDNFEIKMTETLNTTSGDFTISFENNLPHSDSYNFEITGGLSKVKKGESFKLKIDSLSIEADGETLVKVTADLTVKTKDCEIEIPDGDQIDIGDLVSGFDSDYVSDFVKDLA